MSDHVPFRRKIPLPDHQQLEIIQTRLTRDNEGPVYHTEYRVYNWRRLSSGRLVRGDAWSLVDLALFGTWTFLVLRALRREYEHSDIAWSAALLLMAIVYLNRCFSVVLHQSVTPLPSLGVQLSTTRGISLPHPFHPSSTKHRLIVPLSTSYTFIPLSAISTVVINEGLKRWNVRYYLAVIKQRGEGVVVALDEIWAPVAVLREIYHGVREILFDEYAEPP